MTVARSRKAAAAPDPSVARFRCVRRAIATLAVCSLLACTTEVDVDRAVSSDAADPAEAYLAEIEAWRADRLARLTGEDGWVTLIGLFWLQDGAHRIGSAAGSDILLPADKVPGEIGTLIVNGEELRLEVVPDVAVLHDGAPVQSLVLADDSDGEPTVFEIGDLRAYVIRRGDERGLRVKDRNHPLRSTLEGIDHYPTDPRFRFAARFEAYDPPRTIPVPNILGTVNDSPSSGAVVFELDGETHRLDALAEPGDPELFIIFGDQTSGQETYGGGRYLYADAPDGDGEVIVDFNKAYNPPCVFTEFATCPLPPAQNRLPINVKAGEKVYGKKS